jgi:hypothetical protein
MGIHIKTGLGAPFEGGDPGTHYVDISSGKNYLYNGSGWTEVGAGGGLADPFVVSASNMDSTPWTLDLNQSVVLLQGTPTTGPALINCNPTTTKTAKVRISSLESLSVRLQSIPAPGEMRVIARGNVTFTAGSGFADFTPPTGAKLSIDIWYLQPTPLGTLLLVEADAFDANAIRDAY